MDALLNSNSDSFIYGNLDEEEKPDEKTNDDWGNFSRSKNAFRHDAFDNIMHTIENAGPIQKKFFETILNPAYGSSVSKKLERIAEEKISRLAQVADNMRDVVISTNLTPDEMKMLEESYPSYQMRFTQTSNNSHGLAAASRVLEQYKLLDKLGFKRGPDPYAFLEGNHDRYDALITDIGANFPSYIRADLDGFHLCCPRIDPYDANRFTNRKVTLDVFCGNNHALLSQSQKNKIQSVRAVENGNEVYNNFYCNQLFQNCAVRTPYGIAIQSLYDIKLQDIAQGMINKNMESLFATVIYDDSVFRKKSGVIAGVNMFFSIEKRKGEEKIIFFFTDNSYAYSHDYRTYMSLFILPCFTDRTHTYVFFIELQENIMGVQYLRINRKLCSEVNFGNMTHILRFPGLAQKYRIKFPITDYDLMCRCFSTVKSLFFPDDKNVDRRIADIKKSQTGKFEGVVVHRTADDISYVLEKGILYCSFYLDISMVDEIMSFASCINDTKFRPVEILTFVRTHAAKLYVGKECVRRYNGISPIKMFYLSFAVYINIYDLKYKSGLTNGNVIESLKINRERAARYVDRPWIPPVSEWLKSLPGIRVFFNQNPISLYDNGWYDRFYKLMYDTTKIQFEPSELITPAEAYCVSMHGFRIKNTDYSIRFSTPVSFRDMHGSEIHDEFKRMLDNAVSKRTAPTAPVEAEIDFGMLPNSMNYGDPFKIREVTKGLNLYNVADDKIYALAKYYESPSNVLYPSDWNAIYFHCGLMDCTREQIERFVIPTHLNYRRLVIVVPVLTQYYYPAMFKMSRKYSLHFYPYYKSSLTGGRYYYVFVLERFLTPTDSPLQKLADGYALSRPGCFVDRPNLFSLLNVYEPRITSSSCVGIDSIQLKEAWYLPRHVLYPRNELLIAKPVVCGRASVNEFVDLTSFPTFGTGHLDSILSDARTYCVIAEYSVVSYMVAVLAVVGKKLSCSTDSDRFFITVEQLNEEVDKHLFYSMLDHVDTNLALLLPDVLRDFIMKFFETKKESVPMSTTGFCCWQEKSDEWCVELGQNTTSPRIGEDARLDVTIYEKKERKRDYAALYRELRQQYDETAVVRNPGYDEYVFNRVASMVLAGISPAYVKSIKPTKIVVSNMYVDIFDYVYENRLKFNNRYRDMYLLFPEYNRSSFKLLEILSTFSIHVRDADVLDLCGAPGGFVHVLNDLGANTILTCSIDSRKYFPSARCVSRIQEIDILMESPHGDYDLITADGADDNAFVDDTLFRRQYLVALDCLRAGGSLVIKHSNYFLLDTVNYARLYDSFEEITVFKSTFSPDSSTECYFVCIGYRLGRCLPVDQELHKYISSLNYLVSGGGAYSRREMLLSVLSLLPLYRIMEELFNYSQVQYLYLVVNGYLSYRRFRAIGFNTIYFDDLVHHGITVEAWECQLRSTFGIIYNGTYKIDLNYLYGLLNLSDWKLAAAGKIAHAVSVCVDPIVDSCRSITDTVGRLKDKVMPALVSSLSPGYAINNHEGIDRVIEADSEFIFIEYEVAGDRNNCLFRSLSRDLLDPQELREYLRDHPLDSISDCKQELENGVQAGTAVINYFCAIFGASVNLYDRSSRQLIFHCDTNAPAPSYHVDLWYESCHYGYYERRCRDNTACAGSVYNVDAIKSVLRRSKSVDFEGFFTSRYMINDVLVHRFLYGCMSCAWHHSILNPTCVCFVVPCFMPSNLQGKIVITHVKNLDVPLITLDEVNGNYHFSGEINSGVAALGYHLKICKCDKRAYTYRDSHLLYTSCSDKSITTGGHDQLFTENQIECVVQHSDSNHVSVVKNKLIIRVRVHNVTNLIINPESLKNKLNKLMENRYDKNTNFRVSYPSEVDISPVVSVLSRYLTIRFAPRSDSVNIYSTRPVLFPEDTTTSEGRRRTLINSLTEIRDVWKRTGDVIMKTIGDTYHCYLQSYYMNLDKITVKDTSFGLYDLLNDKWLVKPRVDLSEWTRAYTYTDTPRFIDIEGMFDHNGNITKISRDSLKNEIRYLAVNKSTKIMNEDLLYRAVSNRDIGLSSLNFEISAREGCPGSGKTSYIIEEHDHSLNYDTVVVTASREAAKDLRRRVIDKYYKDHKGDNVQKILTKKYCTIDSFLINYKKYHGRAKVSTLYVDEGLMKHFGHVLWAAEISGCKSLVICGDTAQIPYFNSDGMICQKHSFKDRVNIPTKYLKVSHRMPADVCVLLNTIADPSGTLLYRFTLKTTNVRDNSLEIIPLKSGAASLPVYDPEVLYLTFTREEKYTMQKMGYLNTFTNTEKQGYQNATVFLVRLNPKPLAIYEDRNQVVVGVSRHYEKFAYYTVVTNDYLAQCINHVVTKISRVEVARRRLRGGGYVPQYYNHFDNTSMFARLEEYVTYPDFRTILKPDTAVSLENEMGIVRDLVQNNGFSGYISCKPKFLLNYDPSMDQEITPIFDAACYPKFGDPLNVIQFNVDMIRPMSSSLPSRYSREIFLTDPLYIKSAGFSLSIDRNIKELRDTLTPSLRTACPMNFGVNQRTILKAFDERNGGVPELEGRINATEMSELMIEKFVESCVADKDLMHFYTKNPIAYNVDTLKEWAISQPPGLLNAIEKDDSYSIFEKEIGTYSYILKRIAKPCLDPNPENVNQSPQAIAHLEKKFNAVFCPVVKELKKRVLSVMRKDKVMYADMSPKQFTDILNFRFPPKKLLHYAFFYEIDFSKYDKSQGLTALKFEIAIMRLFGFPEELIGLWILLHVVCRLKNIPNFFRAFVEYQRKSGDAMTFLGNTLFMIAVLCVLVCLLNAFCVFSGDDSYIFSQVKLDIANITALAAALFNLEAKILKFKYPYFCSKFLIPVADDSWIVVPDAWKVAIKLGRSDLVSYEHVEQYRASLLDNLEIYGNLHYLPLMSDALADRYNLSFYPGSLFVAIFNAISDPALFSEFYYLHDGDVLSDHAVLPSLEI